MSLTTTGISGLDAQLGGGVPRGSTILLFAEPGNAISLFSEQFAGGGLGAGEHAYYYEFDRPVGRLARGVRQFAESTGAASKASFQLFDGYSTQFGKGSIPRTDDAVVNLVKREDAMDRILRDVQATPYGQPYRVVVESLSALVVPGQEERVIEFLKRLAFLGHELGGVHLVSVVKGLHDPVFETKLRHHASGVLELGMERKGFGIYPFLLVAKMMNLRDPVRLLLFKETDKGLWLESTKRVF